MHRFVLPFFCQREGAEVHGDAACGTKVTVRLHRFVRTQLDSRLDSQLVALASSLERGPGDRLRLDRALDGPPFDRPGSGWYWQIRRGDVPAPDDDLQADMYETADTLLAAAGYSWYEVSNWATDPALRCRHNELYWSDANWWGIGPGAHSHVGGVRWWNRKHPAAYASVLAEGNSPGAGRELLTETQRYEERVLLGIRRDAGLALDDLEPAGRTAVAGLIGDGLVDGPTALRDRRLVLTLRGRLLADTAVRRLLDF